MNHDLTLIFDYATYNHWLGKNRSGKMKNIMKKDLMTRKYHVRVIHSKKLYSRKGKKQTRD